LAHGFKAEIISDRPDTPTDDEGRISTSIKHLGALMQSYRWWPWALVLAGALILWFLGFKYTDQGAIWLMGLLVVAAGGYLVMWEKRGWRK
jgi:hypothetical protein